MFEKNSNINFKTYYFQKTDNFEKNANTPKNE